MYPDCTTLLSVYNSDYLCFAHADEKTRARFQRAFEPRLGPVRYQQSTPG